MDPADARQPRLQLVTPPRVGGLPPVRALTSLRVTAGRYVDDESTFRFVDNWTSRAGAHKSL